MTPLPRLSLIAIAAALMTACSPPAVTTPTSVSETTVTLQEVVAADQPWGMAFLPDGSLLFTEKEGGLKFFVPGSGAAPAAVAGVPAAFTDGQAGYLGIALGPDFAESRLVYAALSSGTAEANSTLVVRGRLAEDASALEGVEEVFRGDLRNTAYHYGSRLAFANDGTLFITVGEGYSYMQDAQDPKTTHGKVVRVNPDGYLYVATKDFDGIFKLVPGE